MIVASDQYPGLTFTAALGTMGSFSAQVPLKIGDNVLTVTAAKTFRARAKIISHFIHPGFRPSSPDLKMQNPQKSLLFQRFCTFRSNKSDPNPGA